MEKVITSKMKGVEGTGISFQEEVPMEVSELSSLPEDERGGNGDKENRSKDTGATGLGLKQALVDFLVTAGVANDIAGTYADRLIAEDVKSVAELKALKEEDLKDPKIGMKLGEISRLRPHLTAAPPLPPAQQVIPKKSFVWGPRVDDSNYHVPFAALQLGQLISRVEIGGCALAQGSYRSGKTSHLYALADYCKTRDLLPLIFTCYASIENDLWSWFSRQLQANVPHAPEIRDINEAHLVFSPFSSIFGGKKIVLLFDEFQLVRLSQQRLEFMQLLKQLQDSKQVVQAIIGFGTFSLFFLSNPSLKDTFKAEYSPFPYESTIYITRLPESGVRQVFEEWAKDRHVTFEDGILENIWLNTSGYAGLVGIIGTYFQNITDCAIPENKVLSIDFYQSLLFNVKTSLQNSEQFAQLLKKINGHGETMLKLVNCIMFTSDPYYFDDPNDFKGACILADYGVLIHSPEFGAQQGWSRFFISASLMRSVLLELCYTVPRAPGLMFDPSMMMTPLPLVKYLLQNLNVGILSAREVQKSKNYKDHFPSEYAFQAEVYAILREAFSAHTSPQWFVLPEAKSDAISRQKRADILVKNGHKVLIELKSGLNLNRTEDLKTAVNQCGLYTWAHRCDLGLLLNFTPYIHTRSMEYPPVYDSDSGVKIVVVNAVCDPTLQDWDLC